VKRATKVELDAVLADVLRRPDLFHGPGLGGGSATVPLDAATDALLDSAGDLLAERGIRGWTIDDVAARAGLGRATVYRRFSSREELVRASMTREARRFFAVIAGSVEGVDPLEEKVVRGFVAGLRLARSSPLGLLLRRDAPAAVSLLRSEILLQAAADALIERYATLGGVAPGAPGRARVEAVADGLIRLGLSFVLVPGATSDLDDDLRAVEHLGAIIRPLVTGRGPLRPAPPIGG
jgi:TetR/AcrR family transcriptional repressor of uid operon